MNNELNRVFVALTNNCDWDTIEMLFQDANSWDGRFAECCAYTLDDLCELYAYATREMLDMIIQHKLDLSDELFWNDDVYWYSGNIAQVHDNMTYYMEDLAEWICDNAGTSAFSPCWRMMPQELIDAICYETELDAEDL